jgi:hypothetical protein
MDGPSKSRVLHFTWLEMLAKNKLSSLLGPFVSYKEDEVLMNTTPVAYTIKIV